MTIFDFNHEQFQVHCEAKRRFISANYDKPVTELEYIDALGSMPKHLHWSNNHSPSAAKHEYKSLTNTYGLFTEDAKVLK